jgi:hypothetical protein
VADGLKSRVLAALLAPFAAVHLEFRLEHSPTGQKYLLETMGGGAALFDYDNDGRLDLFFVNGASLPSLRRDDSRWWNRLYRQRADGTFEDVTSLSKVSQQAEPVYGMGAATGDYDNDGFADLYVTGYPRNALFHNNRDGTFTEVTATAGVAGSGWSASAAFFDYDRDGHLDLFVARYLDWDISRNLRCGGGEPAYCNPDQYGPVSNLLFRNRGDGTFEDVTARSGIAQSLGKGLGVAACDYDDDGWTDVFVANDGVPQFLFRNAGNGRFTERAFEAGFALSDDGKTYAGMGIDCGDYDNDGRLDVLVTNLATEMYALYRNEGRGGFRYTSLATGLAGLTFRNSGWGFRWFDYDNDGWRDLFLAQGHVLDNIERIAPGRRYVEPPALLRNCRGRFERIALEDAPAMPGRGAAFGDIDGDGRVDVVMTALGRAPVLFRNHSPAGQWLGLELKGTRSNRDAIGARVRVSVPGGPVQTAVVTTAGSYLSAGDKRLHFGLGAAREAEVEIRWPGGKTQVLHASAGRYHRVEEPL